MLLAEQGAQVRIYQSSGSSFHLKAYLFSGSDWGRAFIGSSNISRQALQHGLEWNYRIDYPGDDGYLEAQRRFDELFGHPRCAELSDAWIDAYEKRRSAPLQSFAPGSTEHEPPPTPSKVQYAALQALSATRAEGYLRGLVVLATGLGKTWLAAFDVKQMGARRVLDLDVPMITLPVIAGRNLAVLTEAAARLHILRAKGVDPAAAFLARHSALLDRTAP